MTVPERGAECLEPSDMSGKLENSQNSENPEDLGGLGDVLEGVLGGEEVEQHTDKEGEDAKKVNNVEKRKEEVNLNHEN